MSNKHLYIAYKENCICCSPDDTVGVPELASNHEEADCRMLLHMNHNIDQSDIQKKKFIHTPDTDVPVLCLDHLHEIHGHLHKVHGDVYIKTGTKDRSQIISLKRLKRKIESSPGELGCTTEEFCEALHAFAGCDTVSSFAGKGKTKTLKIMKYQHKYVSTFKGLGESWNLEKGLLQNLEDFVWAMYGDQFKNVNDLRYKIYCSKRGKISCEDLPTCKSALIENCKRANYQSKSGNLPLNKCLKCHHLLDMDGKCFQMSLMVIR